MLFCYLYHRYGGAPCTKVFACGIFIVLRRSTCLRLILIIFVRSSILCVCVRSVRAVSIVDPVVFRVFCRSARDRLQNYQVPGMLYPKIGNQKSKTKIENLNLFWKNRKIDHTRSFPHSRIIRTAHSTGFSHTQRTAHSTHTR